MTIEQKSWQLHEHGISWGEVASFACTFECSMDEAVVELWETKVQGKPIDSQFNSVNWQ